MAVFANLGINSGADATHNCTAVAGVGFHSGNFTADASGTITSLNASISSSSASLMKFALYTGSGTLLATSGAVACDVGTVSAAVSVAVTSGTSYNIVMIANGSFVADTYTAGTNVNKQDSGNYASFAEDPRPSFTWNNGSQFLLWAEGGAASSITITDVDTDEIITNGQSAVITGTGFESPNVVTIDGVTQTVTGTPTSTSITITHVLGTMKYGSQTLTVTNDSSDSGTKDITVNPASGYAYVTLTSVTSSDITAIASLVIGDQLEYENTTTGGDAVSVSAGGVIAIDGDPAGDSFDVRANDGTGWGTSAAQSATGETPVQTQDGTGALIVTYPSLTS